MTDREQREMVVPLSVIKGAYSASQALAWGQNRLPGMP